MSEPDDSLNRFDQRFDDHFDDHFDEMTGLLYLEGQLDSDRERALSAHLSGCGSCRALLGALEKEAVWLRESLVSDDESIPARLIAEPHRGSIGWGWIVAFGLGMGGAYTLWTSIIQPSIAQAAQAGFTQGNVLTMLFFTGAFWKGWDSMRNLPEFLAGTTLATVALWLLRKHWQRFTTIAFVVSAVACMLALPPSAGAAEVQHGDPNYTLPAGQELENDLIVAAERARIDGDVDGDVISFSNSLTVNGHVKGDVIAFGREIIINGPVDGNVRSWGETVSLNSTVGRNVTAWVAQLTLDEKASIGGSVMMGVQNGELDGHVAGDVLALANDLALNGKLDRDVTTRGDRLTIGSTAEIDGQIKYEGRGQPEVASGAKLAHSILITVPRRGPDYTRVAYYWHQVLFWGASFLFGLVLLLIIPGFFADAVNETRRAGPAVGFGALFLFATPIAVIVVCLTIVGIGIGLSALMLYGIAIYAAQVFVGSWLGEKILGHTLGIGPAVARLALGLAVLRVLRMIPFVGPVLGLIIMIWGLGALVLAAYSRMRPHAAPATA
ncbi:MAG TPA: polymer-forming cytoskeletal protein [Candidatus Acidoferrales bacterium]|jgi:cytoskeletal protein CcmA (bactofilin family)|nr:polymer-forming cytoskeletal protein [Candidatus Acidoferrales bacterium]